MAQTDQTPQTTTEPVLLPCPFCGTRLTVTDLGYNPLARCDTDGCWMNRQAISITLDDSCRVKAWNTRTTPQPLAIGLDREAELLGEIDALTKALTGLTCGGSEFFSRKGERYVADIEACVGWVHRCKEDAHRRTVDAILARKAAEQKLADALALAAPAEGYVLVPVEPKPEMVAAWHRVKNGHHFDGEPAPTDTSDYAAYRAMIAACLPAAPTGGRS